MGRLYFINNSNRTLDIEPKVKITNQIQQRSDSCDFKIVKGIKPTEYQDIQIYDAGLVLSQNNKTIILKDSYEVGISFFRASQVIFLKIGDTNVERAIIDTYDEATRTITLIDEPFVSLVEGDQLGELVFGGVIATIKDVNLGTLENINYSIKGVDFTKIYDKTVISDTWEDVDARYVINSFCNTSINFNIEVDNLSYEDDTAIQAEWVESDDAGNPTIDNIDFMESVSSGNFNWSNNGGLAKWVATPNNKNLSEFFGTNTGQPTKGFLMSWFKTNDHSNITGRFQQISSLNTFNGNGTWAGNFDAINIATELTTYKEGTGAVKFDIDVSASVNNFSEIFNGALTSVDISKTKKIRVWVYFPDVVTNITSTTINWASASGANGAFKSVTTDYLGNAFAQFWNLLEFDIENPDGLFGGTIDLTAINSTAIRISYNGSQVDMTGVIIDNLLAIDDTSTKSVMQLELGSNSSNYGIFDLELTSSEDWQYVKSNGVSAKMVGVPDWTSVNYVKLVVSQQGSGSTKWNGMRVNDNSSFTLFNTQGTLKIDDLRSPQLKPTNLTNQLAKLFKYVWYIDYERDIHFLEKESNLSPFDINETSDNFNDIKMEIDVSNLGNRIIIRGAEKTSTSTYSQVSVGDNARREWLMQNKFKNLVITIDNNTSTDLTEAGTTTTNITATSHGLSVGDHIVNRSRADAVREILTVLDPNNFTVQSTTGQVSGDTFSKFSIAKTSGIDGLADESTVDYVFNSNQKSIRATESEATLSSSEFIKFVYNERLDIQLQYTNPSSVDAMKALGLGHGVFDLDPITDRNITDTNTALALARAQVAEFGNPIITVKFKTDQKGLKAGQIIKVTENINRGLDDSYVIQRINRVVNGGKFKDYENYSIQAGTTMNGLIEFFQKLLETQNKIELNTDSIIETYVSSEEEVRANEVNTVATGGIKKAVSIETVEATETNTVTVFTPPFKWEPNGVGQPIKTRWNLCQWG